MPNYTQDSKDSSWERKATMKIPHEILIGLSLIARAIFLDGQVTAPAIASEDRNVWRSTPNPMDFDVQKIIFATSTSQ